MPSTKPGESGDKDHVKKHEALLAVNADARTAIEAVISEHYTRAGYTDPSVLANTTTVSGRIRDILRKKTIDLNALEGDFFIEHFTVEGIPVIHERDLRPLMEKFSYLAQVLQRTAAEPNPLRNAPLNNRFFGVTKKGRLRRMGADTLALRSKEYFFNMPEETSEAVQATNSTIPIINHISAMIEEHRSTVEQIKNDERLPDMKLADPEVLALATAFDHLRNYMLFLINILILTAKSAHYPDVLKGVPGNSYLHHGEGPKGERRIHAYVNAVDGMLKTEAANDIRSFMEGDYEKVMATAGALIEAYYGFIATRDVRYLQDFNCDHITYIQREIMPKVQALVTAFEKEVDEKLDPKIPKNKSGNKIVKREFYKKILRHERDGDHPGVNMVNVLSHMSSDGEPKYDLVCGMVYGGIEFPILYRAMSHMLHAVPGDQQQCAFLVLSNYNLGFNPLSSARLDAHIFPEIGEEDLRGRAILVLDDNIITGRTNTQIEAAFRTRGATPKFVVNDLDLDPHRISRTVVLSANLEENASSAVRPIAKRSDVSRNTQRAPDFMNASRYFQ